jgi:hypothetical protein
MMIQGSEFGDFGDLGFGWKSVTSGFRKVGKVAYGAGKGFYSIAKMPAAMARRVATATSGVLCDKSGNPRSGDATSRNFCRAVKLKQQATLRKYLPAAAALASRGAQAKKIAAAAGVKVQKPGWLRGSSDVNLLASLDGADMNDLAYALSGVTPIDIGVVAPADAALFAPSLIAVAAGLWMLYKG